MCGIAGIMATEGAGLDLENLKIMQSELKHRGPDGEAVWSNDLIGMTHTRLSIIDVENGAQPLFGPSGTVLVANGEIYNYVELRNEMLDSQFKTNSDCEPALHYYCKYGPDFCDWLRGMYAIAIFDPGQRRLVLSRDPFGIKPLYYAQSDQGFAFASEARALLATGFGNRKLNEPTISELLQLQFTTGTDTPYLGIERVLPGETIVVVDGKIIDRRRRHALPNSGPRKLSELDALSGLERALLDSVDVHQRSDVPYAMFLSGGVDSSVVLSCMARLNDCPVTAYTIGFPGTGVADERDQARTVAETLGANHIEVKFDENDFWRLLPRVTAAMDEPVADYAILPTWKLAQTAAKNHKVILSGEGGDEVFGGYGRYRSLMRPLWLAGRGPWRRGILDGLGVLRTEPSGWRDGIASNTTTEGFEGRTALQVAQAVDCLNWLPNDLLTKLDRCLMAHGVEGRTPFLDPAVVNFGFCLPDSLKVRGRHGKWILRKWLDAAVPTAGAFSRKKGFTVPVGEWISAQGQRIGELVARQAGVVERCEPSVVESLFGASGKREMFAAWTLLFFALWHQQHVLQIPEGGDAFETLAT